MQDKRVAAVYKEFNVNALPFNPPPVLQDATDEEEFKRWGNAALHRLAQFSDFVEEHVRWMHGVVLVAAADDTVLQGDPWDHRLVGQAMYEHGILSTLEGGPLLGGVRVEQDAALKRGTQECFGQLPHQNCGTKSLPTPVR